MRIHRIAVDNLLSFDHAELDLDQRWTTIVGPNGSGKTNLLRLLSLAGSALEAVEEVMAGSAQPSPAGTVLAAYAGQRHRHAGDRVPRVEIALELTSDEEWEQLSCFIRTAIVSALWNRIQRSDVVPRLASWAAEITADQLQPLFQGSLVLEQIGPTHAPWQVGYEFDHGSTRYRWLLMDGSGRHGIAVTTDPPTSYQLTDLPHALLGLPQNSSGNVALPSSFPPFDLGRLLPSSGEVTELVVQTGGQFGSYVHLDPYRRFAEIVEMPLRPSPPNRGYGLASVLRRLFHRGFVFVGEQLRGVATMATAPRPAGRYSLDELSRAVPSWEPYALPLRLFRLKNGNRAERERFERIQRGFAQLASGRRFDLRFRLESLSQSASVQGVARRPQAEELIASPAAVAEAQITVLVTDGSVARSPNGWELPIELAGAGLWEALVLAEAIVDSEHRLIVLDEPALNLHPEWQRLLLGQLRNAPGQILLVTHSPYLVPMDDIDDMRRVVRAGVSGGATRLCRWKPDQDPFEKGAYVDLRSVLTLFSTSADARSLLFTSGVVLVEGQSELILLPVWFARSEAARELGSPDMRHLGIYAVGGDRGFARPLSFVAALGIPWAIVCDGARFSPQSQDQILRQVVRAGAASPELVSFADKQFNGMTEFKDLVRAGRDHGVFTLARGWTTADKKAGRLGDESLEAFLRTTMPDEFKEATKHVGQDKIRIARWFAANVSCPPEVSDLYRSIICHLCT